MSDNENFGGAFLATFPFGYLLMPLLSFRNGAYSIGVLFDVVLLLFLFVPLFERNFFVGSRRKYIVVGCTVIISVAGAVVHNLDGFLGWKQGALNISVYDPILIAIGLISVATIIKCYKKVNEQGFE